MMENKVRVAVVGCGRMGRRRMRTIVEQAAGELGCVVDTREDEARSVSEEYGCPYYIDYREALAQKDIDCVLICVPNRWHREVAVRALQAKKHVFCEKPLAGNLTDARAMVRAAAPNKVTLKTGSNVRFFRNVLKAKELLDAGAIGSPIFLRSWIGHDGWNLRDQWYGDPEIIGGGTFLDNGCHILDLTRWFLGEVESCIGTVKTNLWPVAPLEDNGFAIFDMAAGQTAVIHASWTDWAGYLYVEVYGTEGYLRIDGRGAKNETVLGSRRGSEKVFDFSGLPRDSYALEMENYLHAVVGNEQAFPSGLDGLWAVEMAWAVYESARKGRRIRIGSPRS